MDKERRVKDAVTDSINKSGLSEGETEKPVREVTGSAALIITIIGVSFALFHLYTGAFRTFAGQQQRAIHLAFALLLIFLLYPPTKLKVKSKFFLYLDVLLGLLAVSSCLYLFVEYRALTLRVGVPTTADLVFGVIIIVLLFEATRRVLGLSLPIIAGVFLIYAFWGPYFPGMLAHRGYGMTRIINQMYLTAEGIFGPILGVSSTFVVLFIFFGAFLEVTKTGQFFLDLSSSIFGYVRGGPAKAAVVGSAFFGSISGSAAANVVGTGSLTIPLMKKTGYSAPFAGAVEALASSGGQIMPPVMGAAAFLMVEFLELPYKTIMLAAAIPALLYFFSIFMAVDFRAAHKGIQGLSKEQIPNLLVTLKNGAHLFTPVLVLIYFLAVKMSSPMKSAVYAIFSALIVACFRKWTRPTLSDVINAMDKGARSSLTIIPVLAIAGVIIGVVNLTGLGLRLSSILVALSGGHLFFLLLLTMVASIILGMGLPTVGCYIILVVLAAPALIQAGVTPIAAHFFVFYFGIISGITPPVAAVAYVAAGIARSNPVTTAIVSCKLGLVAFLLPYIFVYEPAMLLVGSTARTISITISATIGIVALAAAFEGFMLRELSWPERIVLFITAGLTIDPNNKTDIIGIVLFIIMLYRQRAFSYFYSYLITKLSQPKNSNEGLIE